jgi:hypothetical protein
MRLIHYSGEPFTFSRTHCLGTGKFGKPRGFWVSVEGEDDWPSWCQAEGFNLGGFKHAYDVRLSDSARVLTIASESDFHAFERSYLVEVGNRFDRDIDWDRLSVLYDGLIIAPYRWESRLSSFWYYGWDCASGVIWNLAAVASCQPVEVAA